MPSAANINIVRLVISLLPPADGRPHVHAARRISPCVDRLHARGAPCGDVGREQRDGDHRRSAIGAPTTRPAHTSPSALFTTMPMLSRSVAPSAMRTPISFVVRAIVYASTPY